MVIRSLRLGESGFEFARSGVPSPLGDGQSLYLFNHNGPSNFIDSDGLGAIAIPIPIDIPPVIVENPIGAAFCGGAAIGGVLCYAFPNVMTKPGQWIGDLACPRTKPLPKPDCTKIAETATLCLYKCSSPLGPFQGAIPKPPSGCPRYSKVDDVKPMPGRDYPGFPPK